MTLQNYAEPFQVEVQLCLQLQLEQYFLEKHKIGQKPEYKSTYINFSKDQNVHQAAAEFMKLETVSSVAVNEDMKEKKKSTNLQILKILPY